LELLQGFDDGKASCFDPPFNAALLALAKFAVDQAAQVFLVIPALAPGFPSQLGMVRFDEGQFQIIQLIEQRSRGRGFHK
jgi:hypothetical protein